MNMPSLSQTLALATMFFVVSGSILSPLAVSQATGSERSAILATQSVDGSFSPKVVRGTRGNTLNISASVDGPATLNLGSPGNGFWVQMEISGSTEISLNTYETSVEQIVSGGGSLTKKVKEVDRPLAAATYDMNITVDGREVALGKFIIKPRSPPEFSGNIDQWIIPPTTDVSEVTDPVETEGSIPVDSGTIPSVAKGRWVVLAVNTSEFSNGFLRSSENASDLFTAQFEQQSSTMNVQPNRFDETDIEKFVNEPQTDSLYAFVNTGRHGIEAGDRYRANVSVVGDNPFVDGQPSTTADFSVVTARAQLEHATDPIQVNGTDTIRGTTTLPPGERINITASYDGIPPFVETKQATVRANQTFQTTFDFSDVRRGDRFTITLSDQNKKYSAVRIWEVRLNYTGDQITLTEDASVTGEAKVEPGSQFDVQVHYNEGSSSFTKNQRVVVNQTGGFTANFDLSDASSTGNLSVEIPEYNKTVPASLTTKESTFTTTSTTQTTTRETTKTTRTTTSKTTTNEAATEAGITQASSGNPESPINQQTIEDSQSVPGFRAITTIIVLVGCFLVAIRRQ
ncbi:BGTF surface domain-containing protein [Halorussus marinus]|uniref:BGTF surface domain-containing protein n=1 Tax=Halorussus marinus TaxID=2505976 RepID=UPI00109232C0|nr:BGTF surface domain-containing protein [Halorussus marinus]